MKAEYTEKPPEQITGVRNEKKFPSFCLVNDAAESFKDEYGIPKVGETITATIVAKVTGTRSDNYGTSIDFEIHEIEIDDTENEAVEEDDESDREEDDGKRVAFPIKKASGDSKQ